MKSTRAELVAALEALAIRRRQLEDALEAPTYARGPGRRYGPMLGRLELVKVEQRVAERELAELDAAEELARAEHVAGRLLAG